MKMVKKYQIQTIITGANIELLTDEMAENEIFWVQEGKIITKWIFTLYLQKYKLYGIINRYIKSIVFYEAVFFFCMVLYAS